MGSWVSEQTSWSCRLPTEAEWEYACRAGTTTAFWTGKHITREQANFIDLGGLYLNDDGKIGLVSNNPGRTTPVDLFPPNPWGLRDMHGNVWEWCTSRYDKGYSGLEQHDWWPVNDENPRVLRGGSWKTTFSELRSAQRFRDAPGNGDDDRGFRLIRRTTKQMFI